MIMRKKIFALMSILASILFVVYCFEQADAVRGYNATGSEVFTIALPLWIMWRIVTGLCEKIDKLKKYNKKLESHLL